MGLNPCTRSIFACLRRWWPPFPLKPCFDRVFEACSNQDLVFHTAAISGIWGPWKQFHGTNTIGTRNVVEACLQHQIKRLIYTSSPSVTFDGHHQNNTDESAPYAKDWLCHYPHSKALAEKYVLEANDDEELMTCALRPHLIWGPGDHHLIPRLIQRAKSNQLRRVGDGSNLIDTIFVENAAIAHIQAAEALEAGSPVCGSAYFLSQASRFSKKVFCCPMMKANPQDLVELFNQSSQTTISKSLKTERILSSFFTASFFVFV